LDKDRTRSEGDIRENALAAICNLIGSAKRSGLDPEAYLLDVLTPITCPPSIALLSLCLKPER
jgi:hypothetical protein